MQEINHSNGNAITVIIVVAVFFLPGCWLVLLDVLALVRIGSYFMFALMYACREREMSERKRHREKNNTKNTEKSSSNSKPHQTHTHAANCSQDGSTTTTTHACTHQESNELLKCYCFEMLYRCECAHKCTNIRWSGLFYSVFEIHWELAFSNVFFFKLLAVLLPSSSSSLLFYQKAPNAIAIARWTRSRAREIHQRSPAIRWKILLFSFTICSLALAIQYLITNKYQSYTVYIAVHLVAGLLVCLILARFSCCFFSNIAHRIASLLFAFHSNHRQRKETRCCFNSLSLFLRPFSSK